MWTVRVLAGALLVAGCGGAQRTAAPAPPKNAAKAAARAPRFVTPARVIALPDAATATLSFTDDDGSRRLIVQGMRVTERVDGSLERGRQLLPAGRQIRTLELPDRFGGGYLFYTTTSSSSHVWRSKSWTGELEPLANLDLDVESIVDGFDRLYVSDRRAFEVVALDPTTGKVVPQGSLPASPAFSGMAFADAWLGAVEVPFRGVLVTFDAGSSWRPLPVYPTYGVELVAGEIVVSTASGKYAIDRSGVLQQHDAKGGGDAVFRGALGSDRAAPPQPEEPVPPPPPGPLGRRPLRSAVLHGVADSPTTAVVIEDGALGRVRLSDGKLVDVAERALIGGGTCHGVRLGSGFGFVCGQERGATTVYELDRPLALRPVLRFDEPRYVAASQNGGLVVRGRCSGDADEASGAYCVRTPGGELREIRVRGDVGVERVVALSDGRTAVLVPPRLGAPGLLTIVDAKGRASGIKLKLPKTEAPTLALLKKGLWLDGFVERKKGELAGWVAAAGPFVGVRVRLDGTVKVGKIENDLDRALLSGELGLVLGRTGLAAETTDGGFTWREVNLPADDAAGARRSGAGDDERGCSAVGCAFGSWMRVGWRGKKDDKGELETVEPPPPTAGLSDPGGRWQLSCLPTGESFGAAERVVRTPPRVRPTPRYSPHHHWSAVAPPADAVENSDWLPFLGVAPPAKKAGDVGFDLGTEYTEIQVHGYAWGARGASWDRVGNWQLRAYDRFALDRAVWSTAATRTPWPDMVTAAQVFGQDFGAGMASGWQAALEPTGRAGVLVINSRGTVELFLIEEGRSITPVEDAAKWGLVQVSGAVKLGSSWYVGSMVSGSSFRIFKIDGNRIDLFGEYPLRQGHRGTSNLLASVVRNQRGDAVGIWAESKKTRASATSWFVYPLDLESGLSEEPLEVDPAALGATPRACGPDEDGWLLEGEPPVLPYLDFAGGADSVRPRKVEARMLVSAAGVCIDSLSAQAETDVPERLARADTSAWSAAGRASAPLALTDRARAGRRWGFRCAR